MQYAGSHSQPACYPNRRSDNGRRTPFAVRRKSACRCNRRGLRSPSNTPEAALGPIASELNYTTEDGHARSDNSCCSSRGSYGVRRII